MGSNADRREEWWRAAGEGPIAALERVGESTLDQTPA